jgi:hypothetical protein
MKTANQFVAPDPTGRDGLVHFLEALICRGAMRAGSPRKNDTHASVRFNVAVCATHALDRGVTIVRDLNHMMSNSAPLGWSIAERSHETSMTKIKTIVTAAFAALALTTASLAVPSKAFAGGGHGGHRFHVHSSCWKWTPYGAINVCYRY